MIWLLAGCMSSHYILSLAEYDSLEKKEKQAMTAMRLGTFAPARIESRMQSRLLALEVVGKLGVYDPKSVKRVGEVLLDPEAPFQLRSQAAWALGEVGRSLPWEPEGKGIHGILIDALRMELDQETAYYVVEAVGKVYISVIIKVTWSCRKDKDEWSLRANKTS